MSVKVTPKEYADKWSINLANSVDRITNHVKAVTEAPGVKAAAAQAKLLARIQAAINSGKWAKAVSSVSVDDWKKAMIDKGVPRIAPGAAAASDKMESFASKLFDYENKLLADVNKMPTATIDQSIAKMTAWVRGMTKLSKY